MARAGGTDPQSALYALFGAWLRRVPADDRLRQVLSDPAFDWAALLRIADRHAVIPAVAGAVQALDLGHLAPPGFTDFIDDIRGRNATRNRALRAQLLDLVQRLNAIGLRPLLLKGAIRLVDGLYPDASWRYLMDLDLLIDERPLEAYEHLRGGGYRIVWPDPEREVSLTEETVHFPPIAAADSVGKVDLHVHLVRRGHRRLLPTTAVVERATEMVIEGARLRVPAASDQFVHCIAHIQLQHLGRFAGGFSLRDGLETDLLAQKIGPQVEHEALQRFLDAGYPISASAWLAAVEMAFGRDPAAAIAYGVKARLAARGLFWLENRPRMRRSLRLIALIGTRSAAIVRKPAERRRIWRRMWERRIWRSRWQFWRRFARSQR